MKGKRRKRKGQNVTLSLPAGHNAALVTGDDAEHQLYKMLCVVVCIAVVRVNRQG